MSRHRATELTEGIDCQLKRFATILLLSALADPIVSGVREAGVLPSNFFRMAASAAANPMEDGARMDQDWLVEPGVGVGRLRFGLTPEEVSECAGVYGLPTPLIKGSDAAADVTATIAELGLSLSEDEVSRLQDAVGEQANLDRQNLEQDGRPILLEYRDGRLDGITVEARHPETVFDGRRIFEMAPIDVLRLLEKGQWGDGTVPRQRSGL